MKAIIGIGIPASGKTTILKPLAEEEGLMYINADDIREELTGDPRNHSQELQVWSIAYKRIKQGLQQNGVLVDATHAKTGDRKRIIAYCRQHGASNIVAYWIKTDTKTALARNKTRSNQIPERAVLAIANKLKINPPTRQEGFDEIITIET